MDKEAIRVKAQDTAAAIWPGEGSRHQNTDIIEVVLIRVWNEAVEAAATAYCGEYDKSTGVSMLEFKIQQIRRLRIDP